MGFFDSISNFAEDVGDFGHALVTGRWTGGQDSIGDVWNRDPAAILAPLGLLAGGAGLAFGGLGAAGGAAGALGAAEGAGGGSALLGAGELGAEAGALGFGAAEGAGASAEGLAAIDAALSAGGTGGSALGGAGVGAEGIAALDAGIGAGGSGGSALGGGANAAFTSGPLVGGTSGGEAGFLSKLGTGALDSITKNPIGSALAGGGLAMNLLRGNPDDPNRQKLQGQADQLGAQGQALQQYLANGTLPPAMKASLDQATAAAKARIIANHAKNGMSTDPTQNSALGQELSAVETNAVAAMASAQIEMMKTGLNATGLSSQLYEMLTKMDRQNNQDLMASIQNFASALGGGGGRSQTIQLRAS